MFSIIFCVTWKIAPHDRGIVIKRDEDSKNIRLKTIKMPILSNTSQKLFRNAFFAEGVYNSIVILLEELIGAK